MIPFERFPNLPPLFLDFIRKRAPELYPDAPTIEAAAERARQILGRPARIPPGAFRFRKEAAREMAEQLSAGRAVAVFAGHQVGLFTGPLFTLVKAFDAIRAARELTALGIPAVPVFWALTDDHDLEEVARTAKPGLEGPEILLLEGSDRRNRRPVGTLAIPEGIRSIVEAFRRDAEKPQAEEILEEFARRSAPGTSFGEAFIETLFDLVEPLPLLVLDPLREELREPTRNLFLIAVERREDLSSSLREIEEKLRKQGKKVPVPLREDVFPFFLLRDGERHRIEDLEKGAADVEAGKLWPSTDVLTRPVLKSYLLPVAASVLGPAEIAYHAQVLPLFKLFDLPSPVLLPRSHILWRGPGERRAAEALGLSEEELLSPREKRKPDLPPEAARLEGLDQTVKEAVAKLSLDLKQLDPSLVDALEAAGRKVAYQLQQIAERIRKAAERKDEVAQSRIRRLETMLVPNGAAADRLYPPLVPMLAHGREALEAIRSCATETTDGGTVVDLGLQTEADARRSHVR